MVRIVSYDQRWPGWFSHEADRLCAALGDRARRIEHVGSTAVPGLAAKPVIDIVLAVADSTDEASYVPDLESSGFALRAREPDWLEHRFFDKTDANSDFSINLHVFTVGCSEIDRMLAFRDHLRTHDGDRQRYANVKRELAQRTWHDVDDYADAKNAIVDEIHRRIDPHKHQRQPTGG